MLYAMFLLSVLTIGIGLLAVRERFSGVKHGLVQVSYFKLMQGADVPESIIKSTRCFNNMFEVPVIFYVVGTLYIVTGVESLAGTVLAWLFVGLRLAQAYIHLTSNHIRQRMYLFGSGALCVLLLWINLLIERV